MEHHGTINITPSVFISTPKLLPGIYTLLALFFTVKENSRIEVAVDDIKVC